MTTGQRLEASSTKEIGKNLRNDNGTRISCFVFTKEMEKFPIVVSQDFPISFVVKKICEMTMGFK